MADRRGPRDEGEEEGREERRPQRRPQQRGKTPQKQSGGGGGIGVAIVNGIFNLFNTVLGKVIEGVFAAIGRVVGVVIVGMLAIDIIITVVKPLQLALKLGPMPITKGILGALVGPMIPWAIGIAIVLGIVSAISWVLKNPEKASAWVEVAGSVGRRGPAVPAEDADEDPYAAWARGDEEDGTDGGWGEEPPLTRPGGTRRPTPEARSQREQRPRGQRPRGREPGVDPYADVDPLGGGEDDLTPPETRLPRGGQRPR